MFFANRFGIPSLLLSVIVSLLLYYNYEVWVKPFPEIPMKESPRKTEGKPRGESPPMVPGPRDAVPAAFIQVISDKNMFSPDRKEFSSGQGAGDQARPVTRPQVVLYGVLIAENAQMATIVNPGRPLRKGEREAMTIKVGDRIGEYKLAQVMADKIVLEAPGDTFEVPLIDPKAPKKRTEVRAAAPPAAITSTSGMVPGTAGFPMAPPVVPGTPGAPGIAPSPFPRPVMPTPAIPSASPRPIGPSPQVDTSSPMPRPTPPASVPDPGSYRGRRFMGPGTAPESR